MSQADTVLLAAYLANANAALQSFDTNRASFFVERAQALMEQAAPPACQDPSFSYEIGLDPGNRPGNEDTVFAYTDIIPSTNIPFGLFVVADGMGGHADGQLASQLSVTALVDAVLPRVARGNLDRMELASMMLDAVQQANRTVYCHQLPVQGVLPMGTTLTTALVVGANAYLANVGDSRTYLYRPGEGLRAITHDHSVVARLVASGAITREEAYTHEKRNQVTRCLGTEQVKVDLFYEQLADGDILLLCSDGLWEMTRDPHIAQVLATPQLSAADMAGQLVEMALQGGGEDNIGLIVAQYQTDVRSRHQPIEFYGASTMRETAWSL